MFSNKSNLNLVLEFLDSDLEAVIRDKHLVFQQSDVKSWMLMTMKGLDFCHRNWILHRVRCPLIPPLFSSQERETHSANPAYARAGHETQQLVDLGRRRPQTRRFRPRARIRRRPRPHDLPSRHPVRPLVTPSRSAQPQLTPKETLPAHSWYRCPELLLGARSYSTGVDVWAAGCIFGELMLRVPFMAAESDMDQLDVIFSALGTPTEQDWPVRVVFLPDVVVEGELNPDSRPPAQGFTKLASGATFEKKPKNDLSLLFSAASSEAIDLLQRMLAYDPRKRITSREVRRAPCSLLISPNTKETHSHTRTHMPDTSPSRTPSSPPSRGLHQPENSPNRPPNLPRALSHPRRSAPP